LEAALSDQRTQPHRPHASPEPSVDDVRRALDRYRTEFVLLLTPRGEILTSTEDITLGYGNERLGHHIAEQIHPDDLPRVFEVIERARVEPGYRETVRARARRADGSWGTFEATVIDATDEPDLRGAVVRVRDVSEEAQRDAGVLALGADRFQSLAAALPLGILSADARGFVVFTNEAAEQILNLPADQLVGRGWENAIHPDDRLEVVAAASHVSAHGLPRQVVFRVDTAMFARWAHAKFVPLGDPLHTTGWIATVDDITDRRRTESELAHRATHDPLTKLPNRLLLEDRMRQACARLRRDTNSVSVLFIDMDGFKAINDTRGHRAGDQVLVEIARRLRLVVRDVDTVARYAGDEFVVVCESIAARELESVRDRIARTVAQPMSIDGERIEVGASIGVATTANPQVGLEELLARADQDMYRNKRMR
jgi:diguanylate cyclase (GGDEF)-like protein/PAS domain S-box-containing protein